MFSFLNNKKESFTMISLNNIFLNMPKEMLRQIFLPLNINERLKVAAVCKQWLEMTLDTQTWEDLLAGIQGNSLLGRIQKARALDGKINFVLTHQDYSLVGHHVKSVNIFPATFIHELETANTLYSRFEKIKEYINSLVPPEFACIYTKDEISQVETLLDLGLEVKDEYLFKLMRAARYSTEKKPFLNLAKKLVDCGADASINDPYDGKSLDVVMSKYRFSPGKIQKFKNYVEEKK